MSNPRQPSLRDRRSQEDVDILTGARGDPLDRAVRARDLTDINSELFAGVLSLISEKSRAVVQQEVTRSTSPLRQQIRAGKEEAETAAKKAEDVGTQLSGYIIQTDAAIALVGQDFSDLSVSVAASIAGITSDIATLSADVAADIASINADITQINTDIATEIAGVNATISSLNTSLSADIATISTAFGTLQTDIAADLVTINDLIAGLEGELTGDVVAYMTENYYSKTATDGIVSAAIAGLQTTLEAQIDGVEATLVSDYYTAVATDGAISTAISGLQTTLESEIDDLASTLNVNYFTKAQTMAEMLWALEGAWEDDIPTNGSATYAGINFTLSSRVDGVTADLANNYLTSVETNGAITTAVSAAQLLLQSSIDGVAADLATNYYTKAQTDGEITTAVSGAQTALQASLDDLEALLSASYYTAVETDGEISSAISALQTTLQANIDSLSATLSTNYYTEAETDGAISTAVGAAQTALQANIDTLSATLISTYYTKVQTDGEIASAVTGAQTTLQAAIDGLESTLLTDYYTKVQTDGEIASAVTLAQTALQANIDDVNAALATAYYTSVQTDGAISTAISSVQATLQSNIDDVEASLSTNHYTKAETDGEIATAVSAAKTELEADIDDINATLSVEYFTKVQTLAEVAWAAEGDWDDTIPTDASFAASGINFRLQSRLAETQDLVGQVQADLSQNYYTATETDGEIASAVAFAQTALQSNIDDLAATLTTTYYTSAQTDSAIASLQTLLSASITGVAGDLAEFETYAGATYITSANLDTAISGLEQTFQAELNRSTPPTGFSDGDTFWTSTPSGTPEAVAAPHASWTFSASVASQNVPDSTEGVALLTRGAIPVAEADTVRVTIIAKVTGSGAGLAGAVFKFHWLDGAYSEATLTADDVAETMAPGSLVTLSATAVAPPDALFVRGGIAFDGLSYATGVSVDIHAIKLENLMSIAEIEAGISNNFYTKASTDSAIAAGIATYDAQVDGGIAANVTETRVAMADLNGAVARFSALVSAGGSYNAAGIEVLAWDDENSTGTAVKLLGDDVIVEGSLSAQSLVVTDGSGELIPNWNFRSGDLRGWQEALGASAAIIAKQDGLAAMNVAPALYAVSVPASGGEHRLNSESIKCSPGQRFAISIDAAQGGAESGGAVSLQILFYDEDDAWIETHTASVTMTGATWAYDEAVCEAPADAVYFFARLTLTPPASYPIYATNASVVRQRSGAVLITPNSITGAQLITTEALITDEAQIGDLTVTNAKISGDITSDNYAEDGGGNPTAGFKLKRDTGVIKGVEFVDREGLVDGSTFDELTDTYDGVWTPTAYNAAHEEILSIQIDDIDLGKSWQVNAALEMRRYQTTFTSNGALHTIIYTGEAVAQYRWKKEAGDAYGPWTTLPGSVTGTDDWYLASIVYGMNAKMASVQLRVVGLVQRQIITGPGDPAPNPADYPADPGCVRDLAISASIKRK